jgi:hypothetical protein
MISNYLVITSVSQIVSFNPGLVWSKRRTSRTWASCPVLVLTFRMVPILLTAPKISMKRSKRSTIKVDEVIEKLTLHVGALVVDVANRHEPR